MSLTCKFSYRPHPSFVCPAAHFCSLKLPSLPFSFLGHLYDVTINDVLDLFSPAPQHLLTHNSSYLLKSWFPPSESPTDKPSSQDIHFSKLNHQARTLYVYIFFFLFGCTNAVHVNVYPQTHIWFWTHTQRDEVTVLLCGLWISWWETNWVWQRT